MDEIQKDKNLTPNEKMNRIRLLLGRKNKPKSNRNRECEHYEKKCSQFYFSCCKIYDPCKRCHMERNLCENPIVESVECNICFKEQEPSKFCKFCSTSFASYYCSICFIWTDVDDVYHCDQCGICRRGTRETTFHCNKCGTCFHKKFQRDHICFKTSYKEKQCIICHEKLFQSCEQSFSLKCSHFVHTKCFQEYISYGNYTCTFCKKSILDMTEQWNYIRKKIEENPIEEDMMSINEGSIVSSKYGKFKIKCIKNNKYEGEFVEWKLRDGSFSKGYLSSIEKKLYVLVYCNDCLKKSYSVHHPYGRECKYCKGFNTQE